jgi:hypothetical protein
MGYRDQGRCGRLNLTAAEILCIPTPQALIHIPVELDFIQHFLDEAATQFGESYPQTLQSRHEAPD